MFFILGGGTFAMVEKGYYLGASVAVKVLNTGTTADLTNVFMKESKIISEIKHDNIVALEFVKNQFL